MPSDTKRGPIATGGTPWGLAASPVADWLNTNSFANTSNDLTPTFTWDFDIPDSEISEVNLFVSTFKEGEGLLPSDEVVDLSNSSILRELGAQEKQNLLSVPWDEFDDFNPNRILTATWKKDTGLWYWHDGITPIAQPVNELQNTSTRFTLPGDRTLTAGQTYHWAISAVSNNGQKDIEIRDFKTDPVPPATSGDTFSSVTVITHGLKLLNEPPGLPMPLYDMASSIATAGGGGLMMRYDSTTGDWLPVDKEGRLLSGFDPRNYYGKPLVLLSDWSKNFESSIPDSGFTEAAADALFASLVALDRTLGGTVEEVDGELALKQGGVFNSPLHFIGFSRGTVVTSEMIQRIGTYFPEAGGIEGSGIRDLQMTTIDPHDFDQPGFSLFGQGFRDFNEPKIQVWENVTFADNYYQTVPKLDPNLLEKTGTPSGRSIRNADIDVFLGTRAGEPNYEFSRAGFTRETDPLKVGSAQVLAGQGAVHGRVVTWYNGTTNLGMKESPDQIFRRRSDGHYEYLFDQDFYNRNQTPPLNPWYTPVHTDADFTLGAADASWEGIGTGWFYSVLGGGKDKRPPVDMTKRVPLSFDNTPETRMRGDAPVPTLFNGNFDVTTGGNDLIKNAFGMPLAIPGWSFHNGLPMDDAAQPGLYLEDVDPSSERNYALSLGKETLPGVFGIPTSAPPLNEIVRNRLIAPEWAKTLLFDFKVTQASEDDVIEVYMQGNGEPEKLGEFALSETMDEFETFLLNLPSNLIGQLSTLQFKLVDKNQNGLNAQLLLDNVSFTDQVETTALDLITGEGNAAAETVMAAAATAPPDNSTVFNSNLNLSWNAPNQGEPNKLIEIKVDGQFDRFLQVNYQGYEDLSLAADTYRFELEAGGPNLTFTTTALPLQEMYFDKDGQGARVRFQDIDRDRLYGSRFLVTEFTYDENRRRNLNDTKSYLSYRWINAVDPEATTGRTVDLPEGVDDTAVFHRTLADGKDGFVRTKNIDLRLPSSFKTEFRSRRAQQNNEFEYSDPESNGSRRLATWQFDPASIENQQDSYLLAPDTFLKCKTDILDIVTGGIVVGTLQSRGTASEPAEIKLNLEGFKNELRGILTTGELHDITDDTFTKTGLVQDPQSGEVEYRFTQNGLGDRRFLKNHSGQPLLYNKFVTASNTFTTEFAKFLPAAKEAAKQNGHNLQWLAELEEFLNTQAQALLAAVQEDFQYVSRGFTITSETLPTITSPGIAVSWLDIINDRGQAIDGLAFFNRIDGWLQPILVDPNISKPAKEWAMAQGIYFPNSLDTVREYEVTIGQNENGEPIKATIQKKLASVDINVGQHFIWEGANGIKFADYLANTVSQELGHNFGLNDAYFTPLFGSGENLDPNDIMRLGSPDDGNLEFDFRNLNLLQASLGFHESPYSNMADRPFFRFNPSDNAMLMYLRNWNLPANKEGINTSL
ncbi:hypothetical protein NG798_25700 [Ancylothrix sp. C2]|uniref:hypothetical protein n=1 Tax=Ancylothrix sp. D3o TaxID=2953691 RepID=UPI0021BAAC05|nr:hypothetical protein [Ancylothrix sp. D3o]MCT7953196.1 hypothetical protein [Ancylothrix sp. D3o]